MCTAISMKSNDHYFGRTLDLDRSYGEEVCIIPRNFAVKFRNAGNMSKHYAIIGMATVIDGSPLFYDAANEHGLGMAGLNFPENAYYHDAMDDKQNIAPFELIPWILGQCRTVKNAQKLLKSINIVNIQFSDNLPNSPLHWMICDGKETIVVESMRDGLHIYDNPVNAMTNNPPFKYQLENLEKYNNLRTDNLQVLRQENPFYSSYCQGMGALGLPGDASSMSRFVRAAFTLKNSVCESDELSAVGQFFHILSSVEMVRGTVITDDNTFDITGYTSCINADKGLYYYTTYNNRQINCVDMYKTDLDKNTLSRFSLAIEQNIMFQN